MIKINIDDGTVDVSVEGSAEEVLTELSVIIATLHLQLSKKLGAVESFRYLDAAAKAGIGAAHQKMMEE